MLTMRIDRSATMAQALHQYLTNSLALTVTPQRLRIVPCVLDCNEVDAEPLGTIWEHNVRLPQSWQRPSCSMVRAAARYS